jgi:RNA polymerase sigma-70 factor (ECF subfamily)
MIAASGWQAPDCQPAASSDEVFENALVAARPGLQRLAKRMTADPAEADDLVQETLLKGLLSRTRFRPGSNLSAWLRCILRNHFVDLKRRSPVPTVAPPEPVRSHHDGDDASSCQALSLDVVLAALARLHPGEREIIDLATFQGRPYREIASRLGIRRATVGTRLLRARRKLRDGVDAQLARHRDGGQANVIALGPPAQIRSA